MKDQPSDKFGLSLGVGGKYDSYIVETVNAANPGGNNGDTTAYGLLSAYWQHKTCNNMGLRLNYSLYADLHDEFDQYDLMEHLFSVEPQWSRNNFIYSLPIRYTYAREDNQSKYHRYALAPTLTYVIADSKHAFEFYGTTSLVDDVDQYVNFDEDAYTYGGGIGYLIFSDTRTYFKVSGDYNRFHYDARGWDYLGTATSDKRQDEVMTFSALHNIQINNFFDFNISYIFIHTDSNVAYYDYDKYIIQTGVTARF